MELTPQELEGVVKLGARAMGGLAQTEKALVQEQQHCAALTAQSMRLAEALEHVRDISMADRVPGAEADAWARVLEITINALAKKENARG